MKYWGQMYKLLDHDCLLQILCHAAHLTYIKQQMGSFPWQQTSQIRTKIIYHDRQVVLQREMALDLVEIRLPWSHRGWFFSSCWFERNPLVSVREKCFQMVICLRPVDFITYLLLCIHLSYELEVLHMLFKTYFSFYQKNYLCLSLS